MDMEEIMKKIKEFDQLDTKTQEELKDLAKDLTQMMDDHGDTVIGDRLHTPKFLDENT